ncbi:MAG: cell division protein ZipA C-terminal FtsZ-binding domain-containing protein [Gallionella sp.]|nr:cell division protein ZipA C-terminal FtsZ-binding domain-containing protein [Gallionella sp.]
MSELQAALLAIGFGVIVAVYAFGWWQQRQYRRKFGAAFKTTHADALYQDSDADPVEPTRQISPAEIVETAAGEAMQDAGDTAAILPADAGVLPAKESAATTLLDEPCALLDMRSDFIIELHLDEPGPAAVLDGLWQRKFDFGKPVQVCGLTLNAQRWERAIAESKTLYERFRIALQLVDRGGAVSVAKLADFRDLVQGLAGNIKADASVPDVNETHRRAVELDQFCAEVDQMVGVNLVPPGERLLPGAKIAQAAALQGMTLESDGAFHLLNAQGHSLFTLSNRDARPFQSHTLETSSTAGVTLLLDVPRTLNPVAQFDLMVGAAREFAGELQANLVDDHRVVLSDSGLALIRTRIAGIEAKMCGNGIVPGSGQARRLFA